MTAFWHLATDPSLQMFAVPHGHGYNLLFFVIKGGLLLGFGKNVWLANNRFASPPPQKDGVDDTLQSLQIITLNGQTTLRLLNTVLSVQKYSDLCYPLSCTKLYCGKPLPGI